ncbi:hypothetical protein HMPREF1211_01481 [Streptomyces sp. HGB0020]|nr:hypothetical protein HMPREF1211_01481 [Streptomyces sp. HGB0020]
MRATGCPLEVGQGRRPVLRGRRHAEAVSAVERSTPLPVAAAQRKRRDSPFAGDLRQAGVVGAPGDAGPGLDEGDPARQEGAGGGVEARFGGSGQRVGRDVHQMPGCCYGRLCREGRSAVPVDEVSAIAVEAVDEGTAEHHGVGLSLHHGPVVVTAALLRDPSRDRVVGVPGRGRLQTVRIEQFGVVEDQLLVAVVGQAVPPSSVLGVRVVRRRQEISGVQACAARRPVRQIDQGAGVGDGSQPVVVVIEEVELGRAAVHIVDDPVGQPGVVDGRRLKNASGGLVPGRRQVRGVDGQMGGVDEYLEGDACRR